MEVKKKGQAQDQLEIYIEEVPELILQLDVKLTQGVKTVGMSPETEEYYNLAMTALTQAKHFAQLAVYKERQALAATGR